jgi:hypothetical protein
MRLVVARGYKPLNCIRMVFRPEGGFRRWAS